MAFYDDDIETDTLGLALESTANREKTLAVDCHDGHTITADRVVENATIEAKHNAGAYVNIEYEPIDVSSWAGTAPDFVFKFTAGTITSHVTEAFRIRVGPAATGITGFATFGSVGVHFNGQPVNFLIDNLYFDGEAVTMNSQQTTFTT